MKVSIVIPVYYNEDNLVPLYEDIKNKFIDKIDYEYEIVMVNDGSKDKSLEIIKELARKDKCIKYYSLSRNFGSHSAILCGLANCTGDCAIVKAADLQEPTEMLFDLIEKWRNGAGVVLAVREDRDEAATQKLFANLYYWLIRKVALPSMPKGGFDVYLLDRKAINNLVNMNETNSALTGQILWSGFKTDTVYYKRLAREIGKSRWTLKKKIRLVKDTLFSFSILPIALVNTIGVISFIIALVWGVVVLVNKLIGKIVVTGWTSLFIFNLFAFGVIMVTLGILGEYLWRSFDASRGRPPYIVEEKSTDIKGENDET